MTKKLTEEQVAYAARDVIYLHRLHQYLWGQLSSQGLGELATRCFDHIPARVALDIQGYNDIFNYD
jgi:ribonuclease D